MEKCNKSGRGAALFLTCSSLGDLFFLSSYYFSASLRPAFRLSQFMIALKIRK
jgi:hypothetical protein